jgi:putative membrane protein
MLSTVILPWVHYIAVWMMVGALVTELYLLKITATPDAVRLLPRVDRVYGLMAVLVLITGRVRVWHGGKGPDYYWHNGAFHGVLGLFALAALLSLIPTVRYARWRKVLDVSGALPAEAEVRKTRVLVHVQLTAILLITLAIVLVAKGYGYHGAAAAGG